MKKENKVVTLAVMLALLAAPACFADAGISEGGHAVANGIGQILKLPVTILQKASESLGEGTGTTAAGEGVAVMDVYDLDAATTG
jgi:hypothetical protein